MYGPIRELEEIFDPKQEHRQDWMKDEHWYCALVTAKWFNGFPNIRSRIKELNYNGNKGISLILPEGSLDTTKDCSLTRLVVLAHIYGVRVLIWPDSYRYLTVSLLWSHYPNSGRNYHPSVCSLIEQLTGQDFKDIYLKD